MHKTAPYDKELFNSEVGWAEVEKYGLRVAIEELHV
jgi:hypothetical protein